MSFVIAEMTTHAMLLISPILAEMNESGFNWISPAVAGAGVIISAALGFVIAIYGDDIRAVCRRPKLRISLPDLEGEWTEITNNNTRQVIDHVIYFHALVENQKPSRIARDVELYVTDCVVSDTERDSVRMPLPCPLPVQARRRHNGIEVGAAPFAYDLFRCLKSGRIETLLNCNRPNNFKAWINGKGTMWLTFEARGVNAVSNKVMVKVFWDGVFPDEVDGLGDHLTITPSEDVGRRPRRIWPALVGVLIFGALIGLRPEFPSMWTRALVAACALIPLALGILAGQNRHKD